MFIRSFHEYEMEFPLAKITIPKKRYAPSEADAGKRSFIEVDDETLKLLQEDKCFNSLIETKKYRVTKEIPAREKSREDLLQEEVNKLKAALKEKENGVN